MTSSDTRLAWLPTTFTTERRRAPCFFASSIAASVSTVSPDWVTATTSCPLVTAGCRYRYSLAISTSQGIRATRSMRYLPTSAAYEAVPHATKLMRGIASTKASSIFRLSSKTTRRLDLLLDLLACDRTERDRVLRDDRDLAVIEEAHPAGVFEKRGRVRGEEVLAIAVADQDSPGVGDPCRHDLPGVLRRDERERGRALEPRKHGKRGFVERAALRELVLEKMHRDLGVGLAGEAMPLGDERGFQRLEVLDDPVMDHRGHAAAIDMRMRVLLARASVGSPARMADPGMSGGRMG